LVCTIGIFLHIIGNRNGILIETVEGGARMCRVNLRKLVGISAVCFGAGILLSFLLPGFFLAFLEAVVVIAAGILLLGKRH